MCGTEIMIHQIELQFKDLVRFQFESILLVLLSTLFLASWIVICVREGVDTFAFIAAIVLSVSFR